MVHVERTTREFPAAKESQPQASGPTLIDPALFAHISGGLPNTNWVEPATNITSEQPPKEGLPNTNW